MNTTDLVHIRRREQLTFPDFREIWRFRDLLWTLVWRDIAVRYKQTALGAAWALLQPLATMVVLTLFFGRLAGLDQRLHSHIPYFLFAYAGLLPWQLFAVSITTASRSVVTSRQLVTKVYFPRLLLPVAPIIAALIDFFAAFILLLCLIGINGIVPPATIVLAPLVLVLALLAALAVGVITSAANALYRDVEYTMPLLVQLWMFFTPLAYPSSIVPDRYLWLYALNPMAGAVEGFRWACLGGDMPVGMMCLSLLVSTVALSAGLLVFGAAERRFAEAT